LLIGKMSINAAPLMDTVLVTGNQTVATLVWVEISNCDAANGRVLPKLGV
jgi:hypothetical protein